MMLSSSLPEPQFIAIDPAAITTEMIAQYEQSTQKTLYPAQAERLLIDVIAYRETLVRAAIQEAAKQNLLSFAQGVMLDYLGELVGVSRLPAQASKTLLRATLSAPLVAALIIPAGSRFFDLDGADAFTTDADATIPAGALGVDVPATAEVAGVAASGYTPGQISGFFNGATLTNITVTAGGSDAEDDARLRERIRLAPEAFSNAGTKGSYRYHALRADLSVIDVAVISPLPGEVNIYPLTHTGLPTVTQLSQIAMVCGADDVRPICDTVQVVPPIPVDFMVMAGLTLYATADVNLTLAAAKTAAMSYVNSAQAMLGVDIVPTQIIASLGAIPGVYSVNLVQPSATLVLEGYQWAHCTGINLTVSGVANG